MLIALTAIRLQRDAEMPDWLFIQRLALKVSNHISYDAGKDAALNAGRPLSGIFESGWAQCGTFSAGLVGACQASDIPARRIEGVLEGLLSDFDFAQAHERMEVYLQHVGWVYLEPQGGLLAYSTGYIPLDVGFPNKRTRARANDIKALRATGVLPDKSTCGMLLLNQTAGMEVPEVRKAVENQQPIAFIVRNDTEHDVRILWVNHDGQLDTRPECQIDVIKSGSFMGCGGDTQVTLSRSCAWTPGRRWRACASRARCSSC